MPFVIYSRPGPPSRLFIPTAVQLPRKDLTLRAVEIDGNPWFVAADVLTALGAKKTDRGNWLRRLAGDEKGMMRIHTLGGPQKMTVISESGLYKLILRSDKPQAKEFQDWVAREVLPALRKDGVV